MDSEPALPAPLTSALAELPLADEQRQQLQIRLQQRLKIQDHELALAIERALKLVPALLRGAVRRVLGL